MQRTVAVALVAGLIVAASIVVAVALPRFDCPEGFRLIDTRLSGETEELPCEERHPPTDHVELNPGYRLAEVSDRLWIKFAIAVGGLVIGGSLFAFARPKYGRPSPSDPRDWE